LTRPLPRCYHERATAYQRKREFDKAIDDYGNALMFNPQYALAYCKSWRNLCKKGDLDKAIADFDDAIRLDQRTLMRIRIVAWHAN